MAIAVYIIISLNKTLVMQDCSICMSQLSLFPNILCIDEEAILIEAKPQLKKNKFLPNCGKVNLNTNLL